MAAEWDDRSRADVVALHRPPNPDAVLQAERDVTAALVLRPHLRGEVADIVAPHDFASPQVGAVYRVLLDLAPSDGGTLPLSDVLDALAERGLHGKQGLDDAFVSGLLDDVPSSMLEEPRMVLRAARMIRAAKLWRERAAILADGLKSHRPVDTEALARIEEQLRLGVASRDDTPVPVHPVGFTGARLEALRERPDPQSPLPGFLDPEPGLHVCIGRSSVGKTTFALWLAMCWRAGVAPWDGPPPLPGSRSLVISREQNVLRIDRRCRGLDLCAPKVKREVWSDGVSIVARDAELDPALRPLLRLDDKGLALLRAVLQAGRDRGDPYGFGVLDSLSRLKPAECEENSNDHMTVWLDALEEIAEEFGIYLVLLHHQNKVEGGNARVAGRGASAIDAVAQGTWLLEGIAGDPWLRRLRVHGNALDERAWEFEVANDTDPGKILFWRLRPEQPPSLDDSIIAPGEVLSEAQIATRMSGKSNGGTRRKARRAIEQWKRLGWVAVENTGVSGDPMKVRRIEGNTTLWAGEGTEDGDEVEL